MSNNPCSICKYSNLTDCHKLDCECYPNRMGIQTNKPLADSGIRKTFKDGATREITGDKGRMDLIPASSLLRLAKHFEQGAKKYGERDWEKGMPIHCCIDSAIRHLYRYIDGDMSEDHLCAAGTNILMAMWYEDKKPEMQDIPSRLPVTSDKGRGKP